MGNNRPTDIERRAILKALAVSLPFTVAGSAGAAIFGAGSRQPGGGGGGSEDHKLLVDSSDTTADFLDPKLVVIGKISKSILGGGGNEQLQLSHATLDHLFSGLDFTASDLASLATRLHSSLQSVTADQHHAQLHQSTHTSGGNDAFDGLTVIPLTSGNIALVVKGKALATANIVEIFNSASAQARKWYLDKDANLILDRTNLPIASIISQNNDLSAITTILKLVSGVWTFGGQPGVDIGSKAWRFLGDYWAIGTDGTLPLIAQDLYANEALTLHYLAYATQLNFGISGTKAINLKGVTEIKDFDLIPFTQFIAEALTSDPSHTAGRVYYRSDFSFPRLTLDDNVRYNRIKYQGQNLQTKTTTYTVNADNDELIHGDATSGAFTITLPAANTIGITGKEFHFKKKDSSKNAVTISRAGTDTIEGANTVVLAAQYNSATLYPDGVSTWYKKSTT